MERPQLVIFDLGNVVFRIDWMPMFAHWSQASGVPIPQLQAGFHFDAAYAQFERNEISGAEFHRHINRAFGMNLSYEDFCAGWNAIYGEAHSEVCSLLPRLSRQVRLVAFTNTNVVHAAVWPRRYAGELRPFDTIFQSCEIRLRKPEPAAFEYVLHHCGFSAGQTLFFDDYGPNVIAARQLGIRAVLADNPNSVTRVLSEVIISD